MDNYLCIKHIYTQQNLFEAAKTGDVDNLQQMLDEGYSSEERDSSGILC